MKSIFKIIKEEYIKFLKEYYEQDDVDWDFYEKQDEIKDWIFNDFLYRNNETFTKHIPWKVIPFLRLKKIWEDFMRTNIVRDERGLQMIVDIATSNIMKLNTLTILAGHTSEDPSEDYELYIGTFVDNQLNCYYQKNFDKDQLELDFDNSGKGYKKKELNSEPCQDRVLPYVFSFIENVDDKTNIRQELFDDINEKFDWYYTEDPKSGQPYLSDYGLQPLLNLVFELRRETRPENKVVIIDKILNVVHPRSDMAAWFIEGGSGALTQLSGSPSEIAQ